MTYSRRLSVCNVGSLNSDNKCNKKWKSAYDRICRCTDCLYKLPAHTETHREKLNPSFDYGRPVGRVLKIWSSVLWRQ